MKHMFDCAMLGKEKKIKKNDWLFGVIVLLLALVLYLFFYVFYGKEGAAVQVIVDGQLQAEYSLATDRTVEIIGADGEGSNWLVIQEGRASVTEADCPDKLCVKQRAIGKTGESIVCLPHKLVITVAGGEESTYDSITR